MSRFFVSIKTEKKEKGILLLGKKYITGMAYMFDGKKNVLYAKNVFS